VITHTQPFGKRLAFCSYSSSTSGRTITLNVPSQHKSLLADNNTLVHEMVHQFLFERGEDGTHSSAGWRREIMRLTKNHWQRGLGGPLEDRPPGQAHRQDQRGPS
jgi:hypothetical protein